MRATTEPPNSRTHQGGTSTIACEEVRPDERRWSTFPDRRRVLVIARTFTSAVRAGEALDVLRGDFRLEFDFCFDDTSAFRHGVAELLARLRTRQVSWVEAVRTTYHLVITASENVDLTPFRAPVIVLPHGVGFQKWVPDSLGTGRRVSGIVREASRESGDIRLVVSHPDQVEQLRSVSARLAARSVVIGDLAFDRLRAGLRLRERYRDALGLAAGQRLVVLTSTWGERSALGAHERLPGRLLAELPVDGYRVAAVLHPNIWFRHGPWQVRHWLAEALDAGLLLIPPEDGWAAALVAADVVLGDHGSVTLYAAGLDRPLLLAAFGAEEVVADTAIAHLGTHAAGLNVHAALRPQIEQAMAEHVPGRYTSTADRAFAHVGESNRRLADLCYDLLGLPAADNGAGRRTPNAPVPDRPRSARAFEVRSWSDADGGVHVVRYPAAVRPADEEPAGLRHLCAAESEPDQRFVENASVVYRDSGAAEARFPEHARRLLDLYPGALLSATPAAGGCDCLLRDGRTVRLRSAAPLALPVLTGLAYTLLRERRLVTGEHLLHVDGLGDGPHPVSVECATP
ncbi:hypothetical protein [Marinactinospora rubrisoli]|uniref:Uncharacterized protein n=1 Tax=Marinactinospora rubrisoli TaxID=2715399 RepID=A0ABW2KIZ8_9ACTN